MHFDSWSGFDRDGFASDNGIMRDFKRRSIAEHLFAEKASTLFHWSSSQQQEESQWEPAETEVSPL